MANNTKKNVSEIVLKQFTKDFESSRVLSKTVNRQLIRSKINMDTGDHVSLKRPHQYQTIETETGDITGKPKSALISGTVVARVDKYITVAIGYSQLEEAIELNQLSQILSPIAKTMATRLETRLAQYMIQNGALSIGSPGTALTQWGDVTRANSLLTDLGVTGTNYAVISPWATQNLANEQAGLTNNDLVRSAWENAQIPRNFGGLRAITASGMLARTQGTFGGTLTVKNTPNITYERVKDSYQFDVVLTGATASISGLLKAGDQLIFDGITWVNQMNKEPLIDGDEIDFTATVMEDADSDASGDVLVRLSGVPIFDTDNPQYNTVNTPVIAGTEVEVRGVPGKIVKPSLFYNDQFVGMGSVVLPKLHSIDSSVISYDGLSIRVHKYSDGDANSQMMRFDILPTFACFNPMMGGQLFGLS